jgi:soluble lytic murein transglycosylase
MLTKDCMKQKTNLGTKDSVCPEGDEDNDAYSRLSGDAGYYGFLVKIRFRRLEAPGKIDVARPNIPKGKVYERIEMLKFLGMNKEAAEEIKMVLKFTRNLQEVKYLGYTAIDIDEYKSIIYFAEGIKNKEFLPLSYPLGYWDVVKKAAESEAVDAYLIAALIREESRFDPMAVSMAGAVGLMQLMPFTSHRITKELKIELRDDSELYDVRKNILIGTHYLSLLIREFREIPLALAAYNAGENALKRWLVNSHHKDIEEFIEDIPYKETRRYVKKVLRSYWQYKTIEGLPLRKANTVAY